MKDDNFRYILEQKYISRVQIQENMEKMQMITGVLTSS